MTKSFLQFISRIPDVRVPIFINLFILSILPLILCVKIIFLFCSSCHYGRNKFTDLIDPHNFVFRWRLHAVLHTPWLVSHTLHHIFSFYSTMQTTLKLLKPSYQLSLSVFKSLQAHWPPEDISTQS